MGIRGRIKAGEKIEGLRLGKGEGLRVGNRGRVRG